MTRSNLALDLFIEPTTPELRPSPPALKIGKTTRRRAYNANAAIIARRQKPMPHSQSPI
jgi:hypothetical protein